MKIIILLLFPLFFSCTAYNIEFAEDFNTPADIQRYIYFNYAYIADIDSIYQQIEYWQSPKETINLESGDCEDGTVLFMYLCYTQLNIKPRFVGIKTSNGYHAVAEIDGIYYDSTVNYQISIMPYGWGILGYFDYDFIMIYTTGFYTKGIYE